MPVIRNPAKILWPAGFRHFPSDAQTILIYVSTGKTLYKPYASFRYGLYKVFLFYIPQNSMKEGDPHDLTIHSRYLFHRISRKHQKVT